MSAPTCSCCGSVAVGRSSSKIGGVSSGRVRYACGAEIEWRGDVWNPLTICVKTLGHLTERKTDTLVPHSVAIGSKIEWR